MTTYYQQNKTKQQNYYKELYKLNVINKKYHCNECNKSYRDKAQLKRHIGGKLHNKRYKVYKCPYLDCPFIGIAPSHLNKHVNSRKHKTSQ